LICHRERPTNRTLVSKNRQEKSTAGAEGTRHLRDPRDNATGPDYEAGLIQTSIRIPGQVSRLTATTIGEIGRGPHGAQVTVSHENVATGFPGKTWLHSARSKSVMINNESLGTGAVPTSESWKCSSASETSAWQTSINPTEKRQNLEFRILPTWRCRSTARGYVITETDPSRTGSLMAEQ
jgi:hypothetical protein